MEKMTGVEKKHVGGKRKNLKQKYTKRLVGTKITTNLKPTTKEQFQHRSKLQTIVKKRYDLGQIII
jgi:hypothetical protein